MSELNEALLWLAERQGRIAFSVASSDRIGTIKAGAPVVYVEAMSVTVEEAEKGSEAEECHGAAKITAGDAVGVLLTAISAAQERARGVEQGSGEPARETDYGSNEMIDEGDPNTT